MKISDRLRVVYDNLLEGMDVWDFCCDHGYLGGAAYKSRKFANVFFVDQVASIIENLENNFNTFVFDKTNPSQAHFLTEKGEKINSSVNGTLCITGVGAFVINDILHGLALNGFLNAARMILGPQRDTDKLISMIEKYEHLKNYKLAATTEILENGRIRVFFILDKVAPPILHKSQSYHSVLPHPIEKPLAVSNT